VSTSTQTILEITIPMLLKTCASLLLLFSVFISTPSFSATTVLGWSTEQAQTWTRMQTENHPLFQTLKQKADATLYSDTGLYDGLYYLVTGDIAYAQSAYDAISHYNGKDTGGDSPGRNGTRHLFGSMSMLYSWIADVLPATDKAHFKSILELWSDSIFHVNGTRAVDSDESTGHYMGLVMFAIAIQTEDPALSSELLNFIPDVETKKTRPVGGLDVTGNDRATMRNTIADYINISQGGVWLESTYYNANTTRYLTEYAIAINQALGINKFPEITDFIPDLVESEILMLTPNAGDLFQWGDTQAPHSPHAYHRLGLISFLAHYTQDPRLNTLFDTYHASLVDSSAFPHYLIYANPYAPREPLSGRDHNAPGRGLAYHHTGWAANDSLFASAHFGSTHVEHAFENETNFGLYRNGEWVIDNPFGYGLKPKASNTLLISGGLFSAKEARGQSAYEAGDDYLYHVGVTGGHVVYEDYYNPPPESLHEWTRSYLYLHHPDNTDSVIIFDRLNNSNPKTSENFSRYPTIIQDEINLHDAVTQLVFHLPTDNTTETGNKISWQTDNEQTVYLTSFLSSSYSTDLINEQTESPNFLGPTIYEDQYKYQLRLAPSQKSGFQTMLNIVHVGSDATIENYAANLGEKAAAVLIESGGNSSLAIFNGDAGAHPYSINGTPVAIEPTPPNYRGRAGHDPNRQNKNKRLRYFKTGFNLNFTTDTDNTQVYLMDLNPQVQWLITVDDTVRELTPSDAGNLIFAIQSSGSHTINIATVPVDCGVLGDMNNDTQHNIADVVLLINAILNADPVSSCSDVHTDQQNTIQDVIALINLILNNPN